jgi:hypothetical protein
MKYAIFLALVLVGGCGVGVDEGEQSSAITGRGTVATGYATAGQFNTLTVNGSSVAGELCLTEGCASLITIHGRGTVATGRINSVSFNKSGKVPASCARLASLADGAEVQIPVTATSAIQLVLENVCDGSSYALTFQQ